MKTRKNYPYRHLPTVITFLFTIGLLTSISAQTANEDICKDGDCSQEIFTVQLIAPIAGTPNSQRTEQFKKAYADFKRIKSGYQQKPGWQTKYDNFQLAGQSCVRYYQLESQFAHEYEQNPDFKKFIDGQESDIAAFKKTGFKSSRRGLNLVKRMEINCPREIKKVEDKPGPSLEELPSVYMKLGQVQGYFDSEGKILKPMELPPSNDKTPGTANNSSKSKVSKKEQVAQLNNLVNNLPVGPAMSSTLGGIGSALGAAQPKVGALAGLLGALKPSLTSLLTKPAGLLSKLGKVKGLLGRLKGFTPKIPNPGLGSKLGKLFDLGINLNKRAKDAKGQVDKLKNKFDGLTKKTDKVKDDLDKRQGNLKDLQDKLAKLNQRKADLLNRLQDRPKKHLDELTKLANDLAKDSDDLSKEADKENKEKDKLLKKVDDLTKEKEEVADKIEKLNDLLDKLVKEGDDLEKKADDANEEVEAIKAQEKAVEELKEKLEKLTKEKQWQDELVLCEEDLKKLLLQIKPVEEAQEKIKKKMGGILGWPSKILAKLGEVKLFQKKLKLGKKGIPIVGKVLKKVDDLIAKGEAIGSAVEVLTGKKTKLQEKVEGFGDKLDKIKGDYDSKVTGIDDIKKNILAIIGEKTNFKDKLEQAVGDVSQIEGGIADFIKRYELFDEEKKCVDLDDLKEKIDELKKDQEETEPEIEELEADLQAEEDKEKQLEVETQEVEKEIDENVEKAEELKVEQEAIKETFGKDIALDPVTVEEWSESFEVTRPYWDAVFHPDNEVVEGYKGRYFQVRLKDAEKNVKLLFGPGEYFMDKSDFRDNYGSTIGAFVTEALHSLKKSDKGKIKLFVQGSADIAGQNTFKGKLDKRFMYNEVTVLPQNPGSDSFASSPSNKSIPETSFRNTDLPDLRGNFLKEMISIYSKKLDPILLEGQVKKVENKRDRNAVIYLFIPDELIEE